MNKQTILSLAEIIHQSGKYFYVAATGGGTSFLGEFLKIPGGSTVIVGGEIPYNQKAFDAFAGKTEKYNDANAALKLAVASFEKCVKLGFDSQSCIGIGVACSLAKLNERVGREHHINIALHVHDSSFVGSIILPNNLYNRVEEEEIVNNLIYYTLLASPWIISADNVANQIGELIQQEFEVYLENAFNNESIQIDFDFEYDITAGRNLYLQSTYQVENVDSSSDFLLVYPGSFSPLHQGHLEIYNLTKQIYNDAPVFYELSIANSYKPSIDFINLRKRSRQFAEQQLELFVTRAPRFVDKINLFKEHFPNKKVIFVVGADTWNRVFDETAIRNGDIEFFKTNDVKFLAFARPGETFIYPDSELMIKNELALGYNNPISSTQLRKQQQ